MKVSKMILRAMMVAITAGVISSCEKPTVDGAKKPDTQKKTNSTPDGCPACGMG